MDKVKALIRADVSIPTAIKAALEPMTVAEFAAKHDLPPKALSNAINGNVRATEAVCLALAAELGGTVEEWDELLSIARSAGYPWAKQRLDEVVAA